MCAQVAHEFAPDLVIVAAGFDAAEGDPIGKVCPRRVERKGSFSPILIRSPPRSSLAPLTCPRLLCLIV